MDGSIDGMLSAVRATLNQEIQKLRRFPYGEIMKALRGRVVAGVYLIFNESGVLAWVGESKNIRSRLNAHLHIYCGLIDYLMIQQGIKPNDLKAHLCSCGAFIPCRYGNTSMPGLDEAARKMKEKMLETFTVSTMAATSFQDTRFLRNLEFMVQRELRPLYGFWFESKGGPKPIHDSPEPR